MNNIKVDVVIPTYKPDKNLTELISRLLKQTFPINKIFVIDTATGYFPQEVYDMSDNIVVSRIQPEFFDHGGTRNQGMMESHAPFVVFMTQDALPSNENLIRELIAPFEDPEVAASYARQMPRRDCELLEKRTRIFNYPSESRIKSLADLEELGIKTYFCSDVCAAWRRSIWESLGGFEDPVIFNEDMIMAGKMIQAGYKIAYAADAKVIHSHNYTGMQQLHRNFDMAVSQADYPEIFDTVKSESEGIKLVKGQIAFCFKIFKPWLIFSVITKSGCKYIGYKLGKNYRKLPKWLIRRLTSNVQYWNKK